MAENDGKVRLKAGNELAIQTENKTQRRQRACTESSLVTLDEMDPINDYEVPASHSTTNSLPKSGSLEDRLMRMQVDHRTQVDHREKKVGRKGYRRTRSLYGESPSCKFGPKGCLVKRESNTLQIQDPSSQRLTWDTEPLTVLVIKKIFDESVIQPFVELITYIIEEKRMIVLVEAQVLEDKLLEDNGGFLKVRDKLSTFHEGQDDLTDKVDLIICLGGDGTLLYASSLFQSSVPPVMAFHHGSLGFLSPFQFSNFKEKVSQVLKGSVPLSLRTRLKAVIVKSECSIDKSFKSVERKENILVLNEVVIDRGQAPYLCNVDLYIEHKYVTSVQGDGLIIATPTGSTAYSAAAGASMVHPNVPAILITPICPHSLSFRPIVVPAGVEIKVVVSPDARNSAMASFDGRRRQEMLKGEALRITTSIYPVPQVCNEDQMSDWFESLASCLHWNVRKPQKSFSSPSYDSLSIASRSSSESDMNNGAGPHGGPAGNNGGGAHGGAAAAQTGNSNGR